MNKIRIVLADDHQLLRDGLRSMLQQQTDLEIVGEAEDGQATLELLRTLSADVLLLDISMPGLNGIEVLRRLAEISPQVKAVILSMHSDRKFITEALKAGARGYVLKDSSLEELVRAVRSVARGDIYLCSPVAATVVTDYVAMSAENSGPADSPLTSREREVLQLIAEGNSTKEVAFRLEVSTKTVETHRKHLMEKLNLHSVAELTQYAIREKIISVE